MKKLSKTIQATVFTVLLGAPYAWSQVISGDLQKVISGGMGFQTNDISSDGKTSTTGSLIKVIVQYKTPPTSTQFQQATNLGGTLITQYGAVSAAHYGLPKSAVTALAADPNVLYIVKN